MRKSIGKNVNKPLSSKHTQKVCDHAKQPETDALKIATKIAIQKIAEEPGDLVSNKIADIIIKVLRTS